jgi:Domain of unknown function (DUF4251)
MKKVFPGYSRFLFMFLLLLGFVQQSVAQKSKKGIDSAQVAAMEKLLQSQRFEFLATSATPMKGGLRMLSPGYLLRVTKDTLIADLPYFGRSYQAGYGVNEGGVKVNAGSYEYAIKPGKKEGWVLQIKPLEIPNASSFVLTVYSNGSASLQATSSNRQLMMYKGDIRAVK